MKECVRRIKATWDREIEFKSAANKWCTPLTFARRKRRRQTRVEGRKQTCYQGLQRGAEPFNNFLSALKWKHKRDEASLWMLRVVGWKTWPSCDRRANGWTTCCSHCESIRNHIKHCSVNEQGTKFLQDLFSSMTMWCAHLKRTVSIALDNKTRAGPHSIPLASASTKFISC